MDMAPPAGSRFVHIMTLTYSSIFTFLNVYCSQFPDFLKPPGARSLPSLLAAFIVIMFIYHLPVFILNKTISAVWALVSLMENHSNNVFVIVVK